MNETTESSEELLRDELINKILIVSSGVAALAFIGAQLRALHIGWAYRDILQLIAAGSILFLALFRRRLAASKKALLLIIFYTFGGFTGVYTLGMLGGTIFLFPTAVVVMTIFYSMRVTLIYIAFSLLSCVLIAIGFCTGVIKLHYSAGLLTTSYLHWFVYLLCFVFLFAVTFATVYNYRGAMGALNQKIKRQRDELVKTNDELRNASKNVKILSGLLPICAFCKKIRNDEGYWSQIEQYIEKHSNAEFTHSLCPECMESKYPEDSDDVISGDNE